VRDLGPLWVLLGGALLAAATGTRRLLEIVRTDRVPAVATGAALAASIGLAVWWQATQGTGSPPVALSRESLRAAVELLPYIGHQAVGIFGPLDTPLPWPALALWAAALLAVVGPAAVVGSAWEKLVLASCIFTVLAIALAAEAIQHAAGFRAQARHLLPIAMAVPLLAGEILHRHTDRLRRLQVPLVVSLAACAAAAHLLAWHTIGRRFSVGLSGPLIFGNEAVWRPVLGWAPWAGVTAVGALLLLFSALAMRSRVEQS
jgi:hypothetical protein